MNVDGSGCPSIVHFATSKLLIHAAPILCIILSLVKWKRHMTIFYCNLYVLRTDGRAKFLRKHLTGFATIAAGQACVAGTRLYHHLPYLSIRLLDSHLNLIWDVRGSIRRNIHGTGLTKVYSSTSRWCTTKISNIFHWSTLIHAVAVWIIHRNVFAARCHFLLSSKHIWQTAFEQYGRPMRTPWLIRMVLKS